MLIPRHEAHAFTSGGEWYPDSLGGYTVTLSDTISSPSNSFANQWTFLELTCSTAYAGNGAYSKYGYFETKAASGSSHPWFWYSNTGKNFQTAPVVNGYAYMGRWGYDGEVGVTDWWGLTNSSARPTVTFIDEPQHVGLDDVNLLYAVTNQDFIMWVVNNSDFRARYSGGSWTNPSIVRVDNSFGWSQDDTNSASSLAIQRALSSSTENNPQWENVVFYPNPSPLSGSFTATVSGEYSFLWTYTLNGVVTTYRSTTYVVTIATPEVFSFTSVTTQWTGNGQLFIFAKIGGGTATSVKLQHLDSTNPDVWTSVTDLQYGNVNGETGWWWQGYVIDGDTYRLWANDQLDTITYDLGKQNVQSGYDVVNYASQLTLWVTALIASIPDFFIWMPVEVRTVLMSAIVIMIILGLIGWLKS